MRPLSYFRGAVVHAFGIVVPSNVHLYAGDAKGRQMKDGIKIATIGGGSGYTPELVEGFIKRYNELPVRELWLVDIEEGREKLETVGALARRQVEKAGVPLKIVTTLDRASALEGADFVTTQLRVGQLEARMKDERIPLEYGVLGQETNGPGGLFKALRTIPVILGIVEDMKRYCHDTWLINFTNPASMVTEAVMRYGKFDRVIGLCNGPLGLKKGIAATLGVPEREVFVEFQGLNHLVFASHVYHNGRDVTKDVIDHMMSGDESFLSLKNIKEEHWQPDFIRALGMIPISYLRYYYKTAIMVADEQRAAAEEGTRAEVAKKIEQELFELYKDPDLDVKPKQLEQRGGAYYSDAACSLINSIYNDKRDIQTVNVRNNGAITNLDPDAVVEVNCLITKQGPIPLATGDIPVSVKGIVEQIKSFELLGAKAAVTGDYGTALVAMVTNPLMTSDVDAKKMFDELLEAHREYLPNFYSKEA